MEVLTKGRHVDVQLDERVESIDPLPWGRRGMSVLTVERDVQVVDRQGAGIYDTITRGVDHHRSGHSFEGTCFDQVDLPPAFLLGRRAENRHPTAQLVQEGRDSQTRSECRGGDDVVSAGMSDSG